jgi:hypothetical protein
MAAADVVQGLSDRGVMTFVVGFGGDVDAKLLNAMAGKA